MDWVLDSIIRVNFFIGIICIIWGIKFKYNSKRLINVCKSKCKGVLIDIEKIKIGHYSNGSSRSQYTESYVPIYEYEVLGESHQIKGTNGHGFKIGDTVEINYNEDNPKECYIEGYSFILWIVLVIIGIFFCIVGGVVLGISRII